MKERKYVLEEWIRFRAKVIILIVMLFLPGIVLLILGLVNGNEDYLLLGGVFIGMYVFVQVFIICIIEVVYLSTEQITHANWFGLNKKTGKWANLRKVEIKNLKGRGMIGKSICFYFNQIVECDIYYEMSKNKDVILCHNTKKNREVLKEYLPEQFKHVLDDK